MKVAVMQPYFFPYLGYFRLLKIADTFVILDNVQYQRRGWIHRNKFLRKTGVDDWLTLPISKGNRDETLVRDVTFRENINSEELIRPFQIDFRIKEITNHWPNFLDLSGSLSEYLEKTLIVTGKLLGLNPTVVRASSIARKVEMSGEDYILCLCKELSADTYVNAPGGKALYRRERFDSEKIVLSFLTDYRGPKTNVLERILNEEIKDLTEELNSNLEIQRP